MSAVRSALLDVAVEAKGAPRRGSATQWTQWLDGCQRRGEIRGAEREWLGVDQWLGQRTGEVTREDLQGFVGTHQVTLRQIVRGPGRARDVTLPAGWALAMRGDELWEVKDPAGVVQGIGVTACDAGSAAGLAVVRNQRPLFSNVVLEGGKNYRELLITIPPSAASTKAGRLEDLLVSDSVTERYRARARALAERFDATRGTPEHLAVRAAFARLTDEAMAETVAEMGDAGPAYVGTHFAEANVVAHVRFNERVDSTGLRTLMLEEVQSDWAQQARANGTGGGVPPMAFVATQDWVALAMKHVIAWAVEEGFDQVAWTSGQTQADRYAISKRVKRIEWYRNTEGHYGLAVQPVGSKVATRTFSALTVEAMGRTIGKELAARIHDLAFATPGGRGTAGVLEGADLVVGGEGMRIFYDSVLPLTTRRFLKPLGGSVDTAVIAVAGKPVTVHAVVLTPAMRDAVAAGFAMFRRAADHPTKSLPLDEVVAIAREFLAGFNGGLDLQVHVGESLSDIYGPDAVKSMGRAVGAYHPSRGVLSLVADGLGSRAEVEATLRHEILGHYGLNTFEPADKRAILDTIIASRQTIGLRSEWASIDRLYADKSEDVKAEEIFSRLAENPRGAWGQLWDAVAGAVAKAARSVGILKGETSAPELRSIIAAVAEGIRAGTRPQRTKPVTDDALFRRPQAHQAAFLVATSNDQRMQAIIAAAAITDEDPPAPRP